MTQVN